jgi:hypothetical protein
MTLNRTLFTNDDKQESHVSSKAHRETVHYAKWITFTVIGCIAAVVVATIFAILEGGFAKANALMYGPIITLVIAVAVPLLFPVKAISFDRHGLYVGSNGKQIPWQHVDDVFMADVTTKLGWLSRSGAKAPAICIALSPDCEHRRANSSGQASLEYDYHYFCTLLERDGPRVCQDIVRAMRD